MKRVLLPIILLLSGCVPFHLEAGGSVSWGEGQRITKKTDTTVEHGVVRDIDKVGDPIEAPVLPSLRSFPE